MKPAKCNEIAFNFCNFSTSEEKLKPKPKPKYGKGVGWASRGNKLLLDVYNKVNSGAGGGGEDGDAGQAAGGSSAMALPSKGLAAR